MTLITTWMSMKSDFSPFTALATVQEWCGKSRCCIATVQVDGLPSDLKSANSLFRMMVEALAALACRLRV
jgi:hypothetical protein